MFPMGIDCMDLAGYNGIFDEMKTLMVLKKQQQRSRSRAAEKCGKEIARNYKLRSTYFSTRGTTMISLRAMNRSPRCALKPQFARAIHEKSSSVSAKPQRSRFSTLENCQNIATNCYIVIKEEWDKKGFHKETRQRLLSLETTVSRISTLNRFNVFHGSLYRVITRTFSLPSWYRSRNVTSNKLPGNLID